MKNFVKLEHRKLYVNYLAKNFVTPLMKQLNVNVENYRICGSCALTMAGLDIEREPHDVDVEVFLNPENNKEKYNKLKETLELLNNFALNSYSMYGNNNKEKEQVYVFKYKEQTVNVFLKDTYMDYTSTFTMNGVKYATIDSTIMKKKLYNREKDYKDITTITKNLLDFNYYKEEEKEKNSKENKNN